MTDAQGFLNQLKEDMAVEAEKSGKEFFSKFFFVGKYDSKENDDVWAYRTYRDWYYKIVNSVESAEDNGDHVSSYQYNVFKFSNDQEDDIYVKFRVEWDSWDGDKFDKMIETAHLVQSKQVKETVYEKVIY